VAWLSATPASSIPCGRTWSAVDVLEGLLALDPHDDTHYSSHALRSTAAVHMWFWTTEENEAEVATLVERFRRMLVERGHNQSDGTNIHEIRIVDQRRGFHVLAGKVVAPHVRGRCSSRLRRQEDPVAHREAVSLVLADARPTRASPLVGLDPPHHRCRV